MSGLHERHAPFFLDGKKSDGGGKDPPLISIQSLCIIIVVTDDHTIGIVRVQFS